MLKLFGDITLTLTLVFAFLQSSLPLLGYYRRNPYLLAAARPAAFGQAIFAAGAYLLLTIAFVTNDFSIAYVAANSHPLLPFLYRATAVWGGHEGSILLWILMLNVWTVTFALLQKNNDSRQLTLAVLGIISFGFLCFLILTSNPFISAPEWLTGSDLNPLLQDPGFVIHPPMLYMGYVGFSVAFAITMSALLRGKMDAEWVRTTRCYALAAWCFLTLGITLGSWWAYRVLGWGGFWFWDPVENASLLPWLSGAALIHLLALTEKRSIAIAWTSMLALIAFALSLLGTFLVRSGVLISAHTFANDPSRGLFLLLLLGILLTASLAVYVTRWPAMTRMQRVNIPVFSTEMSLLIQSGLLTIAMLTVLLGTLYPLILDALKLGSISVGAPYFNLVMAPLVFITLLFMGMGSLSRANQSAPQTNWWKPALIAISVAVCLLIFANTLALTALLTLTLSVWVILCVIPSLRRVPGMSIAHLGFVVLIMGIMLSSAFSQERQVKMKPGEAVNVGPYQFFFIDAEGIRGPNYRGIRGDFEVLRNARHIANLYPEKRIFTVRDMVMTKVDIHPGLFRDLYIALGEPLDQNNWSVRIYYKPFIRWIWLGGILMILGGILSIRKTS